MRRLGSALGRKNREDALDEEVELRHVRPQEPLRALHGHTAVGLGRGDRLSPAMTHGTFHWVFATQAQGLSTKAVYDQFDEWVKPEDMIGSLK